MRNTDREGQELSSDTLIRLDRVGLTFRDNYSRSTRVLRDISLAVTKQEIISLLGPSGCGKTSLLRILAGMLEPTTGICFREPSLTAYRGLAMTMVFQRPTLLPWCTVEENVLLPYHLSGDKITAEIKEYAEHLFRMVHLQGFKASLPSELSGGMQMRAALVRAFLTHPRLILMDEPFSSLDEETRIGLCFGMMQLVAEARASVVFVTHNTQEAALISNRIVQMSPRPGRIIAERTIRYSRPRDISLFQDREFLDVCAQLRAKVSHG